MCMCLFCIGYFSKVSQLAEQIAGCARERPTGVGGFKRFLDIEEISFIPSIHVSLLHNLQSSTRFSDFEGSVLILKLGNMGQGTSKLKGLDHQSQLLTPIQELIQLVGCSYNHCLH